MKTLIAMSGLMLFAGWTAQAQDIFEITGTPIPMKLLTQNYGSVVKGVGGYDLNICNITDAKQSLTSSRVYQALMLADDSIQPVGRQIMLASILRSQSRSWSNILSLTLSSATGVLSLMGGSTYRLSANLSAGAAVASIAGQQLLSDLKPVLSADQLEKFENQVLESALVMDGGSCVERTVFTVSIVKTKPQGLSFRVR